MRACKTIPAAIVFLALTACAGIVLGTFLWRAWRSGLLAKWVITGFILIKTAGPMPGPSRLFREHILDPIPKSVTEIEVDRAREVFGYGYVFHFKIDREDVALIINSRPFEHVVNVQYGGGYLYFDYSPGSRCSMIVYTPGGKGEPSWFTPKKWLRQLEAYEFHEVKYGRKYTWVLLWNQQLGEAYLLAFRGDP